MEDTRYFRKLNTVFEANIDWYEYCLMRYWNDTSIDLRSNWESQWRNIGFDIPSDSDLFRSAYTNVIKSVIDSITSKLANQKVRPYFNAINGTYETKKVVKNTQQYFDVLFDDKHVHKIISNGFKAACIMGKSHIFVNPFTFEIQMLPAHCVTTLYSEEKYGKQEHALVTFLNFPTSQLKDYGINYDGVVMYVKLQIYIDTDKHELHLLLNGRDKKTIKYEHNVMPFITMYYNNPVFGNQTTGLVQELDGIQTQIDFINAQISCAAQSTPVNQTFVIEGSNLTPKDLANKGGMVYGIKMPAGVNTPPVVSVNPRMFDPQWQTMLEYYIKQAYEIAGISQLSAMSKKPSGLDSGVALSTMEDIESDRFETQVANYINSYIDLANLLIEVLPEDDEVLPESVNTSSITWKDVKKQKDLFKVQYSAASSLSKDPAEKIKQVMQMSQIGLIGADKISHYLDMPDLEDAYKEASAVSDGVQQCISRAIEDGDYDVPDWVSYEALAQAITIEQNKLYASLSGDKKNDNKTTNAIKALMSLEENLVTIMEANGYISTQEPTEAMATEEGLGIAPQVNTAPDVTQTISENTEDTLPPETANDQMATPNESTIPQATPEATE